MFSQIHLAYTELILEAKLILDGSLSIRKCILMYQRSLLTFVWQIKTEHNNIF